MNSRIAPHGLCWPRPESPDSSFATFVNAVLKVQFCSSSPRAHFCLRSVCICCWGRKSLPRSLLRWLLLRASDPAPVSVAPLERPYPAFLHHLTQVDTAHLTAQHHFTSEFMLYINIPMVCLPLWKWKSHLSYCVSSSCRSLQGRLDSPVPRAQWPLVLTPWMKEKAGKQCTNIPGVF